MDPLEQLRKQTCPKHKDQLTTIASLAPNSSFPTLGCTLCLDKQDKKLKHLYISMMRLLEIQKTYKEINCADVQKQLHEITYVQNQINSLFEKAKFQIVKHSNDRKLAQRHKIDLPSYDSLEQEYRTEILQFNDKYLDIEEWLSQECSPAQIDSLVRDKYFRENNAITELTKIQESIQLCFDGRVKRNKSIDAQIKKFSFTEIFRLGEYSVQENRSMEEYEKKYKQHNISKFECYVPEADYGQGFDVTFLPRYLKQASIYANRIEFINIQEFSKQLTDYSGEVSEYKWRKLNELSISNKFNDKSLALIFKILQNRPFKILQICQPRQTKRQEPLMMATSQLIEIDIKKGINFTVFQTSKLEALQQLCIDRIELNTKLIQKILNACYNITTLLLIRNGLDKNAYVFLGETLKSNKLQKLTNLTVAQNSLEAESEKGLFIRGQHLRKLEKLNLYGNKIDDSILTSICTKDLSNLCQLILNKNQLKQPTALLETEWNNMLTLSLDNNQIETSFAVKLVNKKWLRRIRIYLNQNKINTKIFHKTAKYGDNVKVSFQKQKQCIESLAESAIDEKMLYDKEKREIKFVLDNLEEVCKKFLVSSEQTFARIDALYDSEPFLTAILCESIVNSSPTSEQIKQSKQISQQLGVKLDDGNIECLALLALKQIFRNGDKQKQVIFSKESSIQSQLGVKILTTQFLGELLKMEEVVKDMKWRYEQVEGNVDVLTQFKNWFIDKIASQYKTQHDQFRIHKIQGMEDGDFKVVWSNVYQQNKILESIDKQNRVKIIPFFNVLRLGLKDFTNAITSQGEQKKMAKIGGMYNYEPIKCRRYGVKVSHMYDNDAWACSKDQNEQWPIAYHSFIPSCRAIANDEQAVMCCRIKNNEIEGGLSYNKQDAINVESTKMGEGYYCFPYINAFLSNVKGTGVSLAGTPYYFIMECRINLNKIRISSSNNQHWMVPSHKDIRPYSVLLIKKADAEAYPSAEELYGSKYLYSRGAKEEAQKDKDEEPQMQDKGKIKKKKKKKNKKDQDYPVQQTIL